MRRRDWIASASVFAALGAAKRASADKTMKPGAGVLTVNEYLHRAALLLDETRRSQDWIGLHYDDLGLASMAWELADARNQLAVKIAAPAQCKTAHMHLLLALENTAAAFDAKIRGDEKKAAQRMAAARAEEQTLHASLEAAKLKMPNVK
jgi:hypothetical protein